MPVKRMRILAVGDVFHSLTPAFAHLGRRGVGAQRAQTVRQARNLLGTFQFEVVLAPESLADGQGYDVAGDVARHSGSLLVGVALSETWLWLPVIERGAKVLGQRALNSVTLVDELEILLTPSPHPRSSRAVAAAVVGA